MEEASPYLRLASALNCKDSEVADTFAEIIVGQDPDSIRLFQAMGFIRGQTQALVDELVKRGWNRAMEVAASTAERLDTPQDSWGGRRVAIAHAIREKIRK